MDECEVASPYPKPLRKHQIPYSLFERDIADDTRFQGWAISLHDWFIRDVKKAILDDKPPLSPVGTTYSLGLESEFAMYNASTGIEIKRIKSGPENYFVRARRAKLREWLLTKVNVNWGKRFTHYEQDDDGVTAFFEDGTNVRGDVLVGADGIGSRVARQLLGDNGPKPQHVPMGVVVGQLTASEVQYLSWIKNSTSFYIGSANTTRIFIGLKSISEDKKTAEYYWIFNWQDEAASSPTYWTATASQEELHSFVLSQLQGISPIFTAPILATPISGILYPPLQIRDMIPPELPTGRVTLLGDAVHPMSPFQGQGGNQAMKDAFSLAKAIAESKEDSFEQVLKEYEREMSVRTTEIVLKNRASMFS